MNLAALTPALAELTRLAGSSADSKSSSGSSLGTLLLPILFIGLIYFGFIRPQRARARRASQQSEQLVPGVQVMTTAGLYGTVAAVEDDAVLIEVAPGVTTRWAKAAIARVVPPPEALGLEDLPPQEDAPDTADAKDHPDDGTSDGKAGTDPGR